MEQCLFINTFLCRIVNVTSCTWYPFTLGHATTVLVHWTSSSWLGPKFLSVDRILGFSLVNNSPLLIHWKLAACMDCVPTPGTPRGVTVYGLGFLDPRYCLSRGGGGGGRGGGGQGHEDQSLWIYLSMIYFYRAEAQEFENYTLGSVYLMLEIFSWH